MNTSEILARLREPFPPEDHVDRTLKGGGKWFYIPWQRIRERLDEVYPEWQVSYSDPIYLDKYCVIQCTLTLGNISRQAPGNAEIELISNTGNDMSRGTPIERAVADAFKNAAEAFGVGAYLDEQSQDKRNFTLRYLHSKGDGRGLKVARENGGIDGSLPTTEQKAEQRQAQAAAEVASIRQQSAGRNISDKQITRLTSISRQAGYTESGLKALVYSYGYTSRKQIPTSRYDEICTKAGDSELALAFNQKPAASA